jgi:hypothetical protein
MSGLLPVEGCGCLRNVLHWYATKINPALEVSPLRGTVRRQFAEGAVVVKRKKVPLSDVPLSVRVPADMVKRLDALIEPLATDAVSQGFTRMSRSLVAKRAMLEGLRVLEERYRPSR